MNNGSALRGGISRILESKGDPELKLQQVCDYLHNNMENCDWAGYYLVDPSRLSDDDKLSRLILISLIFIGVVFIASIVTGHLLIGVLLLAVPGILFLITGSPVRVLMILFAIQIVLTLSQLSTFAVGIGILGLRADDLLTILFVWFWILSLPDGSTKGIRIGLQEYL